MTIPTHGARTPRYAEINAALREDIASGCYPVGELLPSEAELCRRFNVSRFTVREALRRLQLDGMVAKVQGAGTRVLRDAPTGVFVQSYRSVSELTQYAAETHLEIIKTEKTILDSDMANRIGGQSGEVWLLLSCLRRTDSGDPLAFVECFIPDHFAEIAPDLARDSGPIYAGLASAAGEAIEHAVQESQALPAPRHIADALEIAEGAPTLRILRRYVSASGPLISSFNWHHGGDRYIHRTRIGLAED